METHLALFSAGLLMLLVFHLLSKVITLDNDRGRSTEENRYNHELMQYYFMTHPQFIVPTEALNPLFN